MADNGTRAATILNRPIQLGELSLRNRIAMAPMTRQFSPGGVPDADVAAYYARRAAGGVGLIVTEGTYIGHESAGSSDRVPRFHGEDALAGWAAVADAVHAAGGRVFPQLWHVGMDRAAGTPPVAEAPPMGPSGIPLDDRPAGKTMTPTDLDEVIEAFATAAAAAQAAGFDGVELHGAHGYLIDQFLWEHTNRRTDSYGGDIAGRTRFAAEIVSACRAAVTPGFPISFRMSQWKMGAYQAKLAESPQELDAVLAPLARAGVDAFHCSTRRYWLPEFDGCDLNLAGWVKKLTGKPTITVGAVGLANEFLQSLQGDQTDATSIDGLLDRLEADEFDMVAVGRALLADPAWAAKTLAGRHDQVTPFEPSMLGRLH
ncbi:NADH:flavin oxidoreductase [Stackebrandtia nassauensis]|uniref:NADH:flavin oxidoreductase/NADH oxidase n=1 Tax=Stackebrandtia nassauensis (strain DSM 44728 / CIP 108903 / NRRL B-16338 / NBRC 102104 / LLR-40K-21) TaxID=446470 RepID=D3PU31_STANL|nr:NADH:flavin oxidoreductase [Stackebrandtia nassauensis]ADD40977.1 NADH:flavin oxidoreductase/NADH oxidase [Stackebrandtia nassauensis DSM 44728]